MACNENLFDIIQEADRETRLYATALPSIGAAQALGTLLNGVLVTVGVNALTSPDTSPDVQTQLQLSHEQYLRTRTQTQTRVRLDCFVDQGDVGRGTRSREDVERIVNLNLDNVVSRLNTVLRPRVLSNAKTAIVNQWQQAMEDIHNCLESLVEESMITRMPPGPRKTVIRRRRVCDRYEDEF